MDIKLNLSRLEYRDLVRAARALIDISANIGVLDQLGLLDEDDSINYHELLGVLDKEMKLRRQVARVVGRG